MFLVIFITVFAVFTAFMFKRHYRQWQLSTKIPGPPGLPLIGNGLELANKTPIEFVKILRGYLRDYGKFIRVWLGNQLIIVTTDPKDVEVILTSMDLITKSDEYDFIKPWLNTGLLTSTGSKWVSRRKVITPAFHFKILEDFVETFDKQSSILVEKLKRFEGQGEFDIFHYNALCALDVICESAMGISLNAQNDIDCEYVRNVNELADIIHRRSYDFIQRYDFLFKFTPTFRRQQELLQKLHSFTEEVIVARREKLLTEKTPTHDFPENSYGGKKKMALLDLLLQSTIDGKFLTNDDIREEIDTFMFEGHDTTSSALSFTLYNIAKHQKVQQKCIDEIKSVIGDGAKAPVGMKELNELKYLELVCKESLRLYPSVPMFGRKVTKEMMINGKLVPKGASIGVLPYFMARDPEIFENPLEFIPERFEVERTAEKMNPYAYIPFSAGPRNCIGQKFAMYEVKSTISKILRHYHVSLKDNFEPQDSLELIIKSKNGVKVVLKKREW